MRTWPLVFLVACGGSSSAPREVSTIKYTHTTCEVDCGIAPPEAEPRFEPPDEDRGVPVAVEAPAPEPTCKLVAEVMVSLELGNYAEPEERAPRVTAAERRCIAVRLSRDDRQCLVDSYDKMSMAYCAPSLFPDVKGAVVTLEQCEAAGKQMRAQLPNHLRNFQAQDPKPFEKQLEAAIESCRKDRWNPAMLQCATAYVPIYAQYCAQTQPAVIWTRLQTRMQNAVRTSAR